MTPVPEKRRTYLDDVPEKVKEELSKAWGERKKKTYPAAKHHGIEIEEGESFNKVLTFQLYPGHYHLMSGLTSTDDISLEHSDVGDLCSDLITKMVGKEDSWGNGCHAFNTILQG